MNLLFFLFHFFTLISITLTEYSRMLVLVFINVYLKLNSVLKTLKNTTTKKTKKEKIQKKKKLKLFNGQTDGRTTQNYSSEPHKKFKKKTNYQARICKRDKISKKLTIIRIYCDLSDRRK